MYCNRDWCIGRGERWLSWEMRELIGRMEEKGEGNRGFVGGVFF